MPVMPRSEEIKSISERLVSAVSDEERGSELLVQGLITEFLGFIIKHKLFTDEKIADKRSTGQLVPFKRVVSYIEQNYAQKIMLADLAKTAGMTPKYFCSFFYGMTRKTPIEYVNNYRIERACEQLLSTEMSITDIGLNCGFNEISYFIKTFRKAIGTTPHQYRKNCLLYTSAKTSSSLEVRAWNLLGAVTKCLPVISETASATFLSKPDGAFSPVPTAVPPSASS